nr:SHOCT domain-containing protein [Polymorphobacter sp.]
MFGSRRGRPSLIASAARTAGRTAVVVGTANAMSRPRGAAPAPGEAPAPAETPAPVAAPAGGLSDEAIGRLKQLAELNQSGILSDAEFADQKARILAG